MLRYALSRVTRFRATSVGMTMLPLVACLSPVDQGFRPADIVVPAEQVIARSSYDRLRITRAELAAARLASAYDAVAQLRPQFLRARGVGSLAPGAAGLPLVYVNGLFAEGVDALRALPLREVREIRFLDRWQADTRHGGRRHPYGAIEVVLGR